MSESLGRRISASRRSKNMNLDDLGALVGLSRSQLSIVERDLMKGGPDPALMVKIADALGDRSLLIAYLQNNPVYQSVIPQIFPDLNNIRRDPAIIFSRLRKEMGEGMNACEILEQIFENAEPRKAVGFDEIFRAQMEQVVDVKRGIEILEVQLLAAAIMSEEDHRSIYRAQEEKCIRKGHHKPVEVAA